MASVGTANFLIGFGLAVVDVFDWLAAMSNAAPARWSELPRYMGFKC